MAHREVRPSATQTTAKTSLWDRLRGRGPTPASLAAASGAMESLEPRQLLSADLGQGGEWVQWGEGQLAAKRGSFIVSFDQYMGTQQADALARDVANRLGVSVTKAGGIGRGMFAWFEGTGEVTADEASALVGQIPHLKGIEPDRLFQSTRVPNDELFPEQYALRNVGQGAGYLNPGTAGADIHTSEAWETTIGIPLNGLPIPVVGVIDSGVNYNHPDLAQNIWTNPGEVADDGIDNDGNGYVDDIHGFDFGVFDGDPMDEDEGPRHGTMVAGSMGAVGNNGIGVAGVAWNVKIMCLKIADADGQLSSRAIVAAHDYATMMLQRGTNLVATNNSYGGIAGNFYDNPDTRPDLIAEEAAIQRYLDAGGVFVASAGNDSLNNDSSLSAYPASFNLPGIIAVAATDNNDALAVFSNYGVQTVDVAAPGVQILTTTQDGGYGFTDGTSFSGPIVAGVVALLKAYKPNASAIEIREALINGSDQIPALQGRIQSGGRINVARSLQIINISGPVVRSVSPGPVAGQLNPTTGTPFNTVTINFSKDIDPAFLNASGVVLKGSGPDDTFGNANDVNVIVSSVARATGNARQIVITLNLNAFAGQKLPVDTYRLTLTNTAFRDTDGNFLNGTSASGADEVYDFRIIASTGDNEPNDTLAQATAVPFDAGGQANFQGVTLGNGLAGNLDVDLYRIDIPRGAFISAEVFAKRLANPSTLDSYLRLFNAAGQELAFNDQAVQSDSLINFFVNTGGIYYVGVSGFGNDDYDPATSASGSSQSTGTYDLRLRVQIADDDVVTVPSVDPNLPRRLPVDPAQTQGVSTSVITISDSREILDVNVKLDINHTFDGDLLISLISPDGTEIQLSNRRGGNGDNFTNTIFDDEATLSITSAGAFAPYAGSFRPEQPLGGFDARRGNGLWTLKINDTTGLNSGFLNSWSLQFTFQNDIFGAFESNDTIVSAKDLPGVNGTGSGQIQAFIGDGGFGSFDRDIFRFTANAGSSLTAIATPTAGTSGGGTTLNTAMRLFDEQGTEIKLANPSASLISRIDNYVFATGGTFYLAVSESANITYIPTTVGDATSLPSLTTGNYTLTVDLAGGVSDPALVLRGNALEVGMDTSGRFGATDASGFAGLNYNGIEFLVNNGRFFGLTAGGNSFTNASDTAQLPFSLTDQSDASNSRVTSKSAFRGINVERSISYGQDDTFAAVDVYLTNIGLNTMTGLTWMEGMNADPGLSLGDQVAATSNDVDATGKMASAKYINNQFGQGLTMALAAPSAETRAGATVLSGNQTVRDAAQLAALPAVDPNGTTDDSQLALTYTLGDLAPGARVSMRYFIFFGNTPADVANLYAQVNDGTGAGHLTANSAAPSTEVLETGEGPVVTAPTLPYRVYYSEGFYGDNIFTFLPISNPNDQATRVTVIARYEQGTRDQLVGELNIAANSRSGLTLLTPDLFRSGTALAGRVNPGGGVPAYALEIRSERPVAATFSHYDLNLVGGANVAIGEAFTTRVSTQWTFGEVNKGNGNSDFLTFYNPNNAAEKVLVKFYPQGGGPVISQEFFTINLDGTAEDGLAPYRRGGFAVNDIPGLADGAYGVTVECQVPIVAAMSHFNTPEQQAAGEVGAVGLGSTTGVSPEGQFGLNAEHEQIGVLNPGTASADVTFAFLFENGSAYRTLLTVPGGQHGFINVQDLPNFPTGTPYGVSYTSTQPVSVGTFSDAFSDGLASSFADTAYTVWGFGEGFRPGDNDNHPGVVEYLRIYNPSTTDSTIEITITYDGVAGGETFRRTIPAKRVAEFNIDQFVTGTRRASSAWYSLTVKAPNPVVAYMGHYDRVFPGGFGTLGTPSGLSAPVT